MFNLPETTINIVLGSFLGIVGGMISLPLNALITRKVKKDEQFYQHKLDIIAKERELILQHRLEMKQLALQNNEIGKLQEKLLNLENKIIDLEKVVSHE